MTKEEENFYLRKFKELYINFPSGEIKESEQPDFIVINEKCRIGIELTEIFQDSHLKGYSKFQQSSSDQNYFTDELISIIQKYVPFTFHIAIDFNEFKPVKRPNQDLVLRKISRLILNRLIYLENKTSIIISDFRLLPVEINSLEIGRYDGLDESFDLRPEGGVVSDLENIHIQDILMRKHKKLNKYQKCDEQWLLIREGNYYAGSFADIKISTEINTLFDKLFILRTNYNEIVELK